MLTSMTGFGAGTASDQQRAARVSIRAVNHRYLDVVIHLPHSYAEYEERIRAMVSDRIGRGRVEIFASLEEFGTRERTVKLDKGLLAGYAAAVRQAAEVVGPLEFSLAALLAVPGVFTLDETPDTAASWPILQTALNEALDKLVAMRASEGQRLQEDMLNRLQAIEDMLGEIRQRAPVVVQEYKARLQARIAELLSSDPLVADDRLALEVALFADRSCITEELVRAASHLAHFRAACAETGSVGRKLDFLLQELNREVNTIAAKASDGQIAQLVVRIKAELEKVREQAQNIE